MTLNFSNETLHYLKQAKPMDTFQMREILQELWEAKGWMARRRLNASECPSSSSTNGQTNGRRKYPLSKVGLMVSP